jgi:hypothetical protein
MGPGSLDPCGRGIRKIQKATGVFPQIDPELIAIAQAQRAS